MGLVGAICIIISLIVMYWVVFCDNQDGEGE